MALTQYYTATSLDGFIADPDNSLQWLFDVAGDDPGQADEKADGEADGGWDAFFSDVGALAMGATTWEWVVAHEDLAAHPERWTATYGERPCWVFGHRELTRVPDVDVRFVSGDVRPVHEEMVAAAGERNRWIIGGGDLVGQFHDAGLLDQLLVQVAPVTLGGGAPLLPRRIEGLRLTDVRRTGPLVALSYDVPRT